MQILIAALFLCLSAVLTTPARAADNCVSLDILAANIGTESHVVLRGDATVPFVETYNSEPGDQVTPLVNAVIVALLPERELAIAFFVVGDTVCHQLVMPLATARKMMAAA